MDQQVDSRSQRVAPGNGFGKDAVVTAQNTVTLLVGSQDGIRQLSLDLATGSADQVGDLAPLTNPIALTADGSSAWAVALVPDGEIRPVTATADGPVVGGAGPAGGAVPCHTAVVNRDGEARTVVVANYTGHTIGVVDYTDLASDGTLSATYHFGDNSHPHQVLIDSDRLLISDLGEDCLQVIDLSVADEPVARIDLGTGAGPRDAVVTAPDQLAVALEIANGAVLVTLERDEAGQVTGGRVTSRVDFEGNPDDTHPSQIFRDSLGRVHVLNRGTHRLCVLNVVGDTLELEAEHPLPDWPMDILERDGVLLVACRDANAVVGLDVSDPTRELFRLSVPSPSSLAIVE